MLQNQRACQLVRSKTGCEPLTLAVAWGARTAGRCAAGVLGAVKHQRFSDQQLETFAARAPGICPKPVCDAGEPCPLPPQDDAVDVSVIVPVHNGERFLRACLDSILHQTYQDLEVLLVDDGSTDASGAICDEYAAQEERVTAVHQKNGGLSAARNTGLERAKGTYLCFVDSDDFLDSRMLETLCRDLQEQNADVAVVGFRMFEREEELAPAEFAVPVQCMTGREAIRSTLVSDELGDFAWNKLYKRELFRDIRYPLGRMMEDQGTTYRIFQQCGKVAGLFNLQLACTEARGRRRYDDELMSGVLNIAPHPDQILGVADVEQPAGVCQRACAYFNDDTHKISLSIPVWQPLCRGEHCSPVRTSAVRGIFPEKRCFPSGLRATNARPYILGRGHFFPKSFVFSNAASTASVTAPRKARSSSRRTP